MKRKDVRKTLKKWINREKTEYNHLYYTFVDIGVGGAKMNNQFESLVDEVDKMIRKEDEKHEVAGKKS